MSINVDFISPKNGEACYFGPLRVSTPLVSDDIVTKAYVDGSFSAGADLPATTGTFIVNVTGGESAVSVNASYVMQGDLVTLSVRSFTFTGADSSVLMNGIPIALKPVVDSIYFVIFGSSPEEEITDSYAYMTLHIGGPIHHGRINSGYGGGGGIFIAGNVYTIHSFTITYNKAFNP